MAIVALEPKQRVALWEKINVIGPRIREQTGCSFLESITEAAYRTLGANGLPRKCQSCGVLMPATRKRGRPRIRCTDCGRRPRRPPTC